MRRLIRGIRLERKNVFACRNQQMATGVLRGPLRVATKQQANTKNVIGSKSAVLGASPPDPRWLASLGPSYDRTQLPMAARRAKRENGGLGEDPPGSTMIQGCKLRQRWSKPEPDQRGILVPSCESSFLGETPRPPRWLRSNVLGGQQWMKTNQGIITTSKLVPSYEFSFLGVIPRPPGLASLEPQVLACHLKAGRRMSVLSCGKPQIPGLASLEPP
jgi:hypothetical protein